MIVPYSTDAPLYHWPISTVVIITVNVIAFFATTFQFFLGNVEEEQITWLFLQFDQINPLQWITAQFMHGDLTHLMGNMFFLFAFGLIVEGKIGNLPFAALYMFITVVDGMSVQIPMFMFGTEGAALGASGVIFAILVMAVLWAPENELDCFFLIFFYWGTFEARVITFGGIYILLQFVFAGLTGFSMSSAMLHVIGILIGFPIGLAMLRLGKVDCEGWDIISRNPWLHQYPLFYSPQKRAEDRQNEEKEYDPVAAALAVEGADPSMAKRLGNAAPRVGRFAGQGVPKKGGGARQAGQNLRGTTTRSVGSKADLLGDALPGTTKPKRSLGKHPGKSRAEEVSAGRTASTRKKSKSSAAEQERCRSHPEFNRLSYLFRQCIESGNFFSAQQTFMQLDRMNLVAGVSESTLMGYISLLGQQKRWVDAVRPLATIISRNGAMADDAILRLAQIQLRVLNRPQEALTTLNRMLSPAEEQMDDAKRQRLAKRDELIAIAKRIAEA